jgi:MFS family permease
VAAFRISLIAPVLLGVVAAQIALGIATPVIALLLVARGGNSLLVGAVASAYFIGFLIGTQTADRVVARLGHARAFVVFAAIAADAALVMALTPNPIAWVVLRLLTGYQMAGLFLVAESWLNDKATPATRGRVFGAYLVASWGGGVAGPLVLDVVPGSQMLFVLVGLAFATALLPMALTGTANPALGTRRHFGLRQLIDISPLGAICCLASGLSNGAFYTLIPVFLIRSGQSQAGVATFLSVAMATALLVQYPVGMLSDRLGRRPVTLAALAVALALAVLMAIGAHGWPLLAAAAGCLFAGVTSPLYGLGAGQVNDHVKPEDYIGAGGGLLFAWSLGSSIGPGVAGVVMGWLGPLGLPFYLCAVLGGAGLFTMLRMRLRAGVPRDRQSSYTPATVAPPRLPSLAPRPKPVRKSVSAGFSR